MPDPFNAGHWKRDLMRVLTGASKGDSFFHQMKVGVVSMLRAKIPSAS
jgi:hypothetical protein